MSPSQVSDAVFVVAVVEELDLSRVCASSAWLGKKVSFYISFSVFSSIRINKFRIKLAQAKCKLVLSLGTRFVFIEERKGGLRCSKF